MKKNVTKFYIALVVLAGMYIVFNMFTNNRVMGKQKEALETGAE